MAEREVEIVEVVDYDQGWSAAFERAREVLIVAIGDYVVGTIEHVGSTSVPGLAAKPIVDIQVGVAGLDESRPAFASLESIGYCYDTVRPNDMHFFDKRRQGKQSYNLQLIPYRSDCWSMRISFREYLRSHADAADEYAALKRELALRFSLEIKAYTEAKSSFIRRVVKLEHAIERAVIRTDGKITTKHLDLPNSESEPGPNLNGKVPLSEAVAEFEREYLNSALYRNNGQVSKTARELGIARKTLYTKAAQYGIDIGLHRGVGAWLRSA